MKKLISLTLAVLFCICLTSCGEDEIQAEADIKYSVYENEGTDMVSFYLTSDIEKDGQWEFSHQDLTTINLAHDLDELQDNAYYRTLIFKPIAEGEEELQFSLTNGTSQCYTVNVSKDDSGIFRITITPTETND